MAKNDFVPSRMILLDFAGLRISMSLGETEIKKRQVKKDINKDRKKDRKTER